MVIDKSILYSGAFLAFPLAAIFAMPEVEKAKPAIIPHIENAYMFNPGNSFPPVEEHVFRDEKDLLNALLAVQRERFDKVANEVIKGR